MYNDFRKSRKSQTHVSSLLRSVLKSRSEDLLLALYLFLKKTYRKRDIIEDRIKRVTISNSLTDFVYAKGDIPVMLIAHVDTFFNKPPKNIVSITYNQMDTIVCSPEGLGADDRAGVFAIMEIIRRGYRPYILFTNGEESEGIGAREAVTQIPPPPVNILIELDRSGSNDACFYNCENPKLEKYIESYNYTVTTGVFTDISILAPNWKIGGVNLSVGYYNQHTREEYLSLKELECTINRVCMILDNYPETKFDYIPKSPKLHMEARGDNRRERKREKERERERER